MDSIIKFLNDYHITIFDFLAAAVLIFNIIKSLNNGFFLSLIYFLRWVLAFIIAKYSNTYVGSYIDKVINNQITSNTIAGITVFLLSLFIIIVIGKAIGNSVKWSGLGGIDKLFGLLFGCITGYIYCAIILSLANYIYIYDKWPNYLRNGASYNAIEYGRKFFEEKVLSNNEYADDTKKNIKNTKKKLIN